MMRHHPAAPRDGAWFSAARFTGMEAIAIASVVATAAGTAVSISAAQAQAAAQARAAQTNAAIMQHNAQIAQNQASADAEQQRIQTLRALGAESAAYGASGVTGEGSAADIIGNSAAQGELARQNILYQGRLKAEGYNTQSQLDTGAAQTALQEGDQKAAAAGLQGASAVGSRAYGLLSGGKSPDNLTALDYAAMGSSQYGANSTTLF